MRLNRQMLSSMYNGFKHSTGYMAKNSAFNAGAKAMGMRALKGAGVGAAVGGLSAGILPGGQNTLQGALSGATIGAAAGGAQGYYRMKPKMQKHMRTAGRRGLNAARATYHVGNAGPVRANRSAWFPRTGGGGSGANRSKWRSDGFRQTYTG